MAFAILYIAINVALESAFPSLYCKAINPGGRELVCGYEHTAGIVQGVSLLFWLSYAYLLVLGVGKMLQRELSKAGVFGFFVNVAFVFLCILASSYFGIEDSP